MVPVALPPLQSRLLVGGAFLLAVAASLSGALSLGYWVRTDAAARGRPSPWLDALLAVALPLWLAVYLWGRGDRASAPSARERLARDWVGVVLVTFVAGSLFSPPDPVSQVLWAAPMLLVGAVVVGYRWTAHDGTPT
jgi:hypothetical protein